MSSVFDHFSGESLYPDLNAELAVCRLSEAIRCRTVNHADHSLTDFSEFDRLQDLMRKSYPAVMRYGQFELIGHAVLITLPGSDPSLLPCLYMSHQDVVPVVRGTERDWCHGAFSGEVADGYIWGRGTLDIKEMVFGILEAAEYLLSRGSVFRRTAYLAFGDDEETLNLGALAIAETLERRGVRLEFVLDEGGGKIEDAAPFGAPGVSISMIDLMEKGYADLELSVESEGGHSSRPYGGSSLEHLARAISAVCDHPFPARMPEPLISCFEALAPYVTDEPLRSLVSDVRGNTQAIAEYCMRSDLLFPFVTTTIAPTMIEGGSAACNVLPQNMRAVINFRLNQGDTVDQIMAHCRSVICDDRVKLRYLQANDPSAVARSNGYGYRKLTEALSPFYPNVVFVPSLTVGATDAHQYERLSDSCLRCSPFMAEAEEVRTGVHGTNERLSIRSYLQGIRVLIRLMELANAEP
ncbi:MAG: M20/M25/M40 family metallo-hydrolase [Oscillospiraceae bacterium]|nr:M20/M25/M40 family metallo-hydrolase [Oscillospiraceae bacterium]